MTPVTTIDPGPAGGRLLECGDRRLDLTRPQVMGILNVTPDSFSDGGDFFSVDAALAQARRMAGEGAAIIDVGGESTRPGAAAVTAAEEVARVVPVIAAIRAALPETVISIDTSRPAVMRAAVAAGAGLINDVRALGEPDALETARELGVPVCLMHMQGEPRTMQRAPHYDDVVREVMEFLAARVEACLGAGLPRARLLVDPGFGFGKTAAHNLRLLRGLDRFRALDCPLLVGLSRKSLIGAVLGHPVEGRLYGSIALATLAVWQGASIVRAHDVGPTVDAVRLCGAVKESG
ncbi:MAG: dihydropteroate synthase [Gammaproteobacteria bacterium]|nr:dihydropteroate synthase [Gammaproteobacteria bacterium]